MTLKTLLGRALGRVLPERLLNDLRFEYKSARFHYSTLRKNKLLFLGQTGLKLNIGCGENIVDGWVNIDLTRSSKVFCWDIRKGLPFGDNSAKYIFSEHMFEHLDYQFEAPKFLEECFRVLEPGGILRLIVPDAGIYLSLYSKGWAELAKVRPLIKADGAFVDYWLHDVYETKMELINAVFRQGSEHKYAYDAETLINFLKKFPFRTVLQRAFLVSDDDSIALDSKLRQTESLYVEGVK